MKYRSKISKAIQATKLSPLIYPAYYGCYYLYFLRMIGPHQTFWYRNSLRAKSITPLISDIDITMVIDRKIPESSLRRIRDFHERSKLFEINLYDRDFVQEMSQTANCYEISKDPDLIKNMSIGLRKPCRVQKTVFLIKTFMSDYHNIVKYPGLKKEKWDYHLRLLDSEMSFEYDLESIIENIANTLPISEKELLKEFLRSGLKLESKFEDFWFLVPNLYIAYSHKTYAGIRIPETKLTPFAEDFMVECFLWDCWGLFGQFHLSPHRLTFEEHMKSFYDLVYEQINESNKARLEESYKKFCSFVEKNRELQ